MTSFLRALRRTRRDHEAVFAEFGTRLLGILMADRSGAAASPRFRVVR